MNILERYPHVNNKLYHFEAVQRRDGVGYLISICKYSSLQDKHVFEDHLNSQQYVNMLEESSGGFDEIFDNQDERNINILLQNNGIETMYGRGDIVFSEEDANKCIVLMQKKFQYSKI